MQSELSSFLFSLLTLLWSTGVNLRNNALNLPHERELEFMSGRLVFLQTAELTKVLEDVCARRTLTSLHAEVVKCHIK